jgi:hypothetical protein
MLKTKDKADNKVSRVRVISKVKAMDSSKVLVKVKKVVMDKDKVRVKEVTVVECRRKCRTSMTVTSRLSMIWPMHNRIKDRDKVMVSLISCEVWEYLVEVEWVNQDKDSNQEWVVKEMVELRNTISKIPDKRRVKDESKMIP